MTGGGCVPPWSPAAVAASERAIVLMARVTASVRQTAGIVLEGEA